MKSLKLAVLALLAASLTAGGLPAYGFAEVPAPVPVAPERPAEPSPATVPGEVFPATPEQPASEPSPATAPAEVLPALPGVEHEDAHHGHDEADGEVNEAKSAEAEADESGEDLGFDPVVGGGFPVPGPNTPMVTDPDGTVRSAVETDISAAHDHGVQSFSTREGGASTNGAAARSGTIQVTIVYATLTDNRGAIDQTAARNSVTAANNYWRSMSNGRLGFSIANSRSINSSAGSWQDYADMMNTIRRDLGWRDSANTALLVYVPAADLKSGGYGGILGGGWTSGPTSGSVLMPRPSSFTNNVVTHEFGHVLGLLHANSLKCNNGRSDVGIGSNGRWTDGACTSREYGDTSDLMGYAQYASPVINSYFWERGSFGRGDEVLNAGTPAGASTYTLKPWAGSASQRAVKFKDTSGETYYLELRLPVGYDSSTSVGGNRGVKIIKADLANNWAVNSLVVAPNTRDFSGYTNANSTWQAGQTFTTHSGTTVKINWISAEGASVTISPLADWSVKTLSPGDFNGDGKSDLLTRRSNGTLWFSAGTGKGTFGAARQIGSGFQIFDMLVSTGDYDGDGRSDFLARKPDGSLWRYSGTGTISSSNEGYRPGVKIGDHGWDAFTALIGVGDANGDGRKDLLARNPNGTVLLYSGTGNGGHGTSRVVASGWNIYTTMIGAGEFSGDNRADLIVRTADGRISLLAGLGDGSFAAAKSIGTGWNVFTEILGGTDFNNDGNPDLVGRNAAGNLTFYAGTRTVSEGYLPGVPKQVVGLSATAQTFSVPDFNGDKRPDLLSVRTDGTLWFHRGSGNGNYQAAVRIGSGWDIYNEVISPGDFNGDGKADVLARKPDGSLWFYAGTGKIDAGNEGYSPAQRIGTGWNVFRQLVGAGDLNNDGKADLLAAEANGNLVLYRGTGKIDARNEGYQRAQVVGFGGWHNFAEITAASDFDGNGTNDLLARTTDGSLLLYRGTGSGTFHTGQQIGSGWNIFGALMGTGDVTGDKKADYTAITPDGVSWFYAGTGNPSEGYQQGVSAGKL